MAHIFLTRSNFNQNARFILNTENVVAIHDNGGYRIVTTIAPAKDGTASYHVEESLEEIANRIARAGEKIGDRVPGG